MWFTVRTWMRCCPVTVAGATMVATAGRADPVPTAPGPSAVAGFGSIRQPIFEASGAGHTACITCHPPVGRPPAGGLNLVTGPYGSLVNVVSTAKPNLLRVLPGNPQASYLRRQLEGR